MKHEFLVPAVVAAMLCSACASSMNPTASRNPFGDPASIATADRTVIITPNTNYVNVADDETVKFIVDGKSFAWTFNGPSDGYEFDLEQVAPPGLLNHKVAANVAANPLVVGGPGE